MYIVIVSATPFEIAPLQLWLKENFTEKKGIFEKGKLQVECIVTGVGIAKTAFHLGLFLANKNPDFLINAGVAGSFDKDLPNGTVVNVIADRFADLGVEEADGSFVDVHQLGLTPPDEPPFQNGLLYNPNAANYDFLPKAIAITVNKVHGHQQSIDAIKKKYNPDIETMEGAAFSYACLSLEYNFLQIRSISNKVEPRNKENWNLPFAIEELNKVLIGILGVIYHPPV